MDQFAGAGPQGPYEAPGQRFNAPPQPPPKNYLIEAIISTVCCCVPLGIVAIVFAAKVDRLAAIGDHRGAQEAAGKAKLFAILAVVLGLLGNGIYLAVKLPEIIEEVKTAAAEGNQSEPLPPSITSPEMLIVPK
jgi:hypothetical protein